MNKSQARLRRGKKTKFTQRRLGLPRLIVNRSNKHISAQVVNAGENGDLVLAYASTQDQELKSSLQGDKKKQAVEVGKLVAKRALKNGVNKIAFDRAGYKFHGRVQAIAEGAREEGLDF
jgi:large subunit ribosomal protein L18